ncbi:hypothetical protein FE782_23155 [Paenibacillus antri]|uniref:Lycopene cyclase domain-containing protein n=1 Tax=Paenibacillus antri TaxID=2582848 RepID=A0A5R9GAZ8_9BACL|nr:hypothetical protein [Paenibacillus antri]TLS49903.1 hypothetical protein FE782_23155 [Paenibacillus antri]
MLLTAIMWGTLILPWLTLLFLPKGALRRYMPVAIFTALLMTIYDEIAIDATDWIVIKLNLVPWTTFVPLIYGAFFTSTIWIFSLTYGRFLVYAITNVVCDFIFLFVLSPVYEWLGFYSFAERSRFGIYVDIVLVSFVIYGYQMWQEKIMNPHDAPPKRSSLDPITFGLRRKAR